MVKNEKLVKQFKLPARFWKITLDDVAGSLKSMWSNTCNKIKEAAKENNHLTEIKKLYSLCMFCSFLIWFNFN